jgi:hypothetical protein
MLDSKVRLAAFPLLALSLTASAAPCKSLKDTSFAFEVEKEVANKRKETGGNLIFAFVDEANGEVETAAVGMKDGGAYAGLDAKALAHVKPGISVRVYNFSSKYHVILVDREVGAMKKDFDAGKDCLKAERNGWIVNAAPGSSWKCESMDLSKMTAATVLYDNAYKACKNFAGAQPKIEASKKLTQAESDDVTAAITTFDNLFGSGRRPSVLTAPTNVTKDKSQDLATS